MADGAVVSWPPDNKKPKTRQLHSTTGAGTLGGAFWGLLFDTGYLRAVPHEPERRCRPRPQRLRWDERTAHPHQSQ